ncbi:hypothetical protein H1C71_033376, partial [Ictidomys tridecemlineatus]
PRRPTAATPKKPRPVRAPRTPPGVEVTTKPPEPGDAHGGLVAVPQVPEGAMRFPGDSLPLGQRGCERFRESAGARGRSFLLTTSQKAWVPPNAAVCLPLISRGKGKSEDVAFPSQKFQWEAESFFLPSFCLRDGVPRCLHPGDYARALLHRSLSFLVLEKGTETEGAGRVKSPQVSQL